jgi:oxalate decarboxylase/phosphoglucose isomerase-like protein (cupin superfamily)
LTPVECVSCIGNPNTDEWQYYIEGQARIGVFGASGPDEVFGTHRR